MGLRRRLGSGLMTGEIVPVVLSEFVFTAISKV